jgi:hypothetical protein
MDAYEIANLREGLRRLRERGSLIDAVRAAMVHRSELHVLAASVDKLDLLVKLSNNIDSNKIGELGELASSEKLVELSKYTMTIISIFNKLDIIVNKNTALKNYDGSVDEIKYVIEQRYEDFFETLQYFALKELALAGFGSVGKLVADLKQTKENHDDLIRELQIAASDKSVYTNATHFKESSEYYRKISLYFYIAIGCLIAALLATGIGFLVFPAPQELLIQNSISKILILGALGYAISLCAKNLHANRHNYVMNRHRYNALSTYKLLVESAATEDKKDLILAQAAQCIFEPQETGYIKDPPPNMEIPAGFIQLLTSKFSK